MRVKLFLWLLGLVSCLAHTPAQFVINPDCGTTEDTLSEGSSVSQTCNNNFSNFRTNHADDMVPQGIDRTLKIKTNVIFVQDDNGNGNYSISNPDHMDYWHRVFDSMNLQLKLLVEENCNCPTMPYHYSNIHIEFVPRFVEIQNSYYWNHRHDPDSNITDSSNKPYLNAIHNLATQVPGYVDGFDWIITTDSVFWYRWLAVGGAVPIWEYGYDCVNGPVYTVDSSCVNYSGFPSYDLNRPAMWHSPDKYLIHVNAYNHVWPYGQDIIDLYIKSTAEGALHEYGHYFGLSHPPNQNTCPSNIMQPGGGSDRTSFSGCQVRTMYETLMTKNLRKYVICEDKLDFSIVVNSDETWAINTRIFGDIEIRDSSTLTITCKIAMDPKSRIIVGRGSRLIVDGGLITSDCSEKWNGIIVEGDVPGKQSNSGKVVLKNMAIIELAKTAVSMNPVHLPWNNGEQQEYYAGIIEATNSIFRNCNTAVAFMKYDSIGLKDISYFDKVKFENLITGVTLWADDGVRFDSCKFVNIQKAGIYSIDSELLVGEKNTFDTIPVGIDILTASLRPFSSKIGKENGVPNVFRTAIGINIQSTSNIEPLTIVNNYFEGVNSSDKGIHLNGNSFFLFQFNSFMNERKAIEVYESGKDFNQILNNEIDDAWIGAHSIKDNLGLHYIDNCFTSSSLMDIAVTMKGIFPFQGNSSLAAGNCFTKNSITEVYNSSSDPIEYFVKSGTSHSSCNYPRYLYNVSLDANATDQNSMSCGTSLDSIISPIVRCDINPNQTISQLKTERSGLISAKSGSTVGSYNFKMYEQCIEVCEGLITGKMLDRNSMDANAGIDNAVTFLTGAGMNFKDSTAAFGILVSNGDVSRARNLLNSITPRNSEQTNFITVQNINLDYLEDPTSYEISSQDEEDLYDIGITDGPFNGYARSLYEILTGERIEVEVPLEWRSNYSTSSNEVKHPVINVYPNPSKGNSFYVDLSQLEDGEHNIKLTDLLGRIIAELKILGEGIYTFDKEYVPDGIYYVSIWNMNNTLIGSKVLIAN